jgi:hypothetical protein
MTCPFCGVDTDAPHESQEACIGALNGEIQRMRALLERLRPPADSSSGTVLEEPVPPPHRSS